MSGEFILEKVKKYRNLVALAAFVLVNFIVILLCTGLLKEPIVAVCVLVILETGLAALLHNAELWLHGVFVLGMVLSGFLMSRPALILLCAVVYIAATAALKVMFIGEE